MTVELSWLSGTLRGDPNVVADRLSRHLRRAQVLPAGRISWEGRWYRQSVRIDGVTLAWEPRASSNAPSEILVDVPQRVLQDLGTARAIALLTRLCVLGLRPTRVDVAVNDPFRGATGATVGAAFKRGDVRGHVRRGEAHEALVRGKRACHAPSATLGSPQSLRRLRVYDGDARHGHGGTRWELQVRKHEAVRLAEQLIGGPIATVTVAAMTGFVDFRSRHDRAHAERSPRLRWWSAIVDHADQITAIGPRLRSALARVASTFLRILSLRRAIEPLAARSVVVIQPDPYHRRAGPDAPADPSRALP